MFFKKDKSESNNLYKVAALLIHAAKIDENFSKNEEIIKKTLLKLGAKKENLSSTIKEAKIIEENSNQILEFTREVKNLKKLAQRKFQVKTHLEY